MKEEITYRVSTRGLQDNSTVLFSVTLFAEFPLKVTTKLATNMNHELVLRFRRNNVFNIAIWKTFEHCTSVILLLAKVFG